MKNLTITIMSALLGVMVLISPVQAEMATRDEALTVAKNWVALIIQKKGDWGGSETAEVEEIQAFKRGQRVIGYFCRVKPKGYIVLSLRKELAAVKAYSATCDLQPECDMGLNDVIKLGMEGVLDAVERQLGPIKSVRTQDLQNILETNYRPVWDKLGGNVKTFETGLESGVITMNYQGGDILLSSSWHQGAPYNNECPANAACTGRNRGRCSAGCVPLAGAQVMRYWAWPPDWSWELMANRYVPAGAGWLDENFNPLTQAQVDIVAHLCGQNQLGWWCDADYCTEGCATGAYFADTPYYDLRDAFDEGYYYHANPDATDRTDAASGQEWFDWMRYAFNHNRPLPYAIDCVGDDGDTTGHVLVADGWRIIGGINQYHMNYGWDGRNTGDACWSGIPNSNTWYTIDALPCTPWESQETIFYVYPDTALLGHVSGTYGPDTVYFNCHYVDVDATGDSATFEPGEYAVSLRFLPGVTMTCTSTTGGCIRFVGTNSKPTRLDSIKETTKADICIYNGGIRLYQNGSIKFHDQVGRP